MKIVNDINLNLHEDEKIVWEGICDGSLYQDISQLVKVNLQILILIFFIFNIIFEIFLLLSLIVLWGILFSVLVLNIAKRTKIFREIKYFISTKRIFIVNYSQIGKLQFDRKDASIQLENEILKIRISAIRDLKIFSKFDYFTVILYIIDYRENQKVIKIERIKGYNIVNRIVDGMNGIDLKILKKRWRKELLISVNEKEDSN